MRNATIGSSDSDTLNRRLSIDSLYIFDTIYIGGPDAPNYGKPATNVTAPSVYTHFYLRSRHKDQFTVYLNLTSGSSGVTSLDEGADSCLTAVPAPPPATEVAATD